MSAEGRALCLTLPDKQPVLTTRCSKAMVPPFDRWGNRGSDRLSNLPKATQLITGKHVHSLITIFLHLPPGRDGLTVLGKLPVASDPASEDSWDVKNRKNQALKPSDISGPRKAHIAGATVSPTGRSPQGFLHGSKFHFHSKPRQPPRASILLLNPKIIDRYYMIIPQPPEISSEALLETSVILQKADWRLFQTGLRALLQHRPPRTPPGGFWSACTACPHCACGISCRCTAGPRRGQGMQKETSCVFYPLKTESVDRNYRLKTFRQLPYHRLPSLQRL